MKPRILFAATALVASGLAGGYFLADDSVEIQRLRAELNTLSEKRGAFPKTMYSGFKTAGKRGLNPISQSPPEGGLTNGGSWPTSELLIRARVTPEDIAVTEALEARARGGEFILKNERPLFRKIQEYDFDSIATATATNRAEAYNQLFGELGVTAEVKEQLQAHLQKIHKASLEAEAAISQVLDARMQYDLRIRSLLNEENYATYRQYEAERPARLEAENIQKFAGKRNIEIDSTQQDTLIQAIHDANPSENSWWGSWHGPYDSLPQFKLGDEEVLTWAKDRLSDVARSSSQLKEHLAEEEMPIDIQLAVKDYYEMRAQERQTAVHTLAKRAAERRGGPSVSGERPVDLQFPAEKPQHIEIQFGENRYTAP